jgi:hypothetical protein
MFGRWSSLRDPIPALQLYLGQRTMFMPREGRRPLPSSGVSTCSNVHKVWIYSTTSPARNRSD